MVLKKSSAQKFLIGVYIQIFKQLLLAFKKVLKQFILFNIANEYSLAIYFITEL